MHEYVGSLHIHTTYSDGTGTVKEIAAAAEEAGLDFIGVTDHNTLRAKREGEERFFGKTLVVVGAELNDKSNRNHYLAFGVEDTSSTRVPAAEYVRAVKEQGGIGFTAHPHEKRSSMKEHPPYPWTAWDVEDIHGIEIWNHMSEWMENLTERNKYQSFVHPLRTIVAPPNETLAKWDELARKRPTPAIGGVDAHAHKVNLLGFFTAEVFSYKVLFKSIRTHILADEPITPTRSKRGAEKAVGTALRALGKGSSFVANYYHGDARGFRFFAETGGAIVGMGDDAPIEGSAKLRAQTPGVVSELRLLRDGKEIERVEADELERDVRKPGAYRVEARLEGKAWIYSNHIRLGL
ncbi:MAG: PHP domain-containing protein [Ignavibacteriales bacterium]|nr:PHP domain-containing protein [Ignavibacteriales bacterium]